MTTKPRRGRAWYVVVRGTVVERAVLVIVSSLAACTSFGTAGPSDPVDGRPVQDDGGADGSPPDGAASAPDGAAGPTDLLPSGTFEDGVCSGWGGHQSTLSRDPTARTGAASCRVCAQAGVTDNFSLDDGVRTPILQAPATYRVEAWVRSVPGVSAPPTAFPFLRQAIAKPFVALQAAEGTALAISDQWQRVEVSLDVTEARGGVNAYIAANPTQQGGCFLVDDVRLFRVK